MNPSAQSGVLQPNTEGPPALSVIPPALYGIYNIRHLPATENTANIQPQFKTYPQISPGDPGLPPNLSLSDPIVTPRTANRQLNQALNGLKVSSLSG